jgi:hypothetical protein
MTECNVCFEKLKSVSKVLACPVCDFVSCKKCLKTYFGSLPEPMCPNCSIVWTRDFIMTNFKNFEKEYKQMRESYLLNQEFALMAETQSFVEQELIVRGLEQKAMEDETFIEIAKDARTQHKRNITESVYDNGFKVLKKCPGVDTNCLSKADENPYAKADAKADENPYAKADAKADEKADAKAEGKADTNLNEDSLACRGFIDKDSGECSLCGTIVCKDCHLMIQPPSELAHDCELCNETIYSCKVLDAFRSICFKCETGVDMPYHGHICKPEDIETAKMIEEDSKPCPKCSVYIYHYEGCDQMWCTQCKTAFSWKSGRIEKGRIHNPHFFEYLRELANGGEIERAENCFVDFTRVEDSASKDSLYLQRLFASFYGLIEILHEDGEPIPPENRDLRMAYLMKEISKHKLGELIQRRDKKYLKDLETFQVYDVCVVASNEIFLDVIEKSKHLGRLLNDDDLEEFKQRIFKVVWFINSQLNYIKRKYKVKPKYIVPYCVTRGGKDSKTEDILARNVHSVRFILSTAWGMDYFGVLENGYED